MDPRGKEWEDRLPKVPEPVANYVTFRRSGRLAFTSGVVPLVDGRLEARGRLGEDLSAEEGYRTARTCALLALSILRANLGGLDRIRQVLQLVVYVASAPDFHDQPRVADGATDLLAEVLGEAGRPARTAVGVAALPLDAPVELAVVVEAAE